MVDKAQEKPGNPEDAEADLPIWAQLASGLEKAWEQLRTRVLQREGIDLDAANRAASAPGQKTPAPEPASASPARHGEAQPQPGVAPLLEELQQNSRPGKRTALDVLDAAIAELAEEEFSGDQAALSQDRLAQPVAAAVTLASLEAVARWVRSKQFLQSGRERRICRRFPLN